MEDWTDEKLDDLAAGFEILVNHVHRLQGHLDGMQLLMSHVLSGVTEEARTEAMTAIALAESLVGERPAPYLVGLKAAGDLVRSA